MNRLSRRNSPKQAVILCGGKGTRLRPLTKNTPKPMVKVNGRPFLLYLMEQIANQGIKRFLLLTGYLGDQIEDYFGNGSQWNWDIKYSSGPTEWDTGKRIWEARNIIENDFLLLYSDNFATLNLKKLSNFHRENNFNITLSIAKKNDGNIELDDHGKVLKYDKNRSLPRLDYVEIGYMIVSRDSILRLYEKPDINFSEIIFNATNELKVGGFIVKDGYKSISDPTRLKVTEAFLEPKKIILIDRDGVINHKAPKGEYIGEWKDFLFIKKNFEAMKILSKKGFSFIIISNQAGIARGMIKPENLEFMTSKMISEFNKNSVTILKSYYCPHHWDEGCECRKPNTGLFMKASDEFSFRLDQSIFIGDDPRDCMASYNANCESVFMGDESELTDLATDQLPISINKNLLNVIPEIVSFYEKNKN